MMPSTIICLQAYRSEFGYWDLFYNENTAPALLDDSLVASRPLTQVTPIRTSSEVDAMYDTLSYNKGAAVLRMLRACLAFAHGRQANSTVFDDPSGLWQLPMRRLKRDPVGENGDQEAASKLPESRRKLEEGQQQDPFLRALTAFLRQFEYGSVTFTDLWGSLSNSTGG